MAPGKHDLPSAAQVQVFRKYLRDHGMTNQDVQRLVRATDTMEQIGLDIAADLRQRPKGEVK